MSWSKEFTWVFHLEDMQTSSPSPAPRVGKINGRGEKTPYKPWKRHRNKHWFNQFQLNHLYLIDGFLGMVVLQCKTLTHAQFIFKSADGILRSRARTNRFHLKNSLFLLCVVTHNRKLEKRTILRRLLTLTFELKKVCRHFEQKILFEIKSALILFQNNKWVFSLPNICKSKSTKIL